MYVTVVLLFSLSPPQDQLAIIASTYRPSEFEISQKPGSSAKFPSENLLSRAPSKDEGQATPEAPCDKKMLIKMNNPPERAPSPGELHCSLDARLSGSWAPGSLVHLLLILDLLSLSALLPV